MCHGAELGGRAAGRVEGMGVACFAQDGVLPPPPPSLFLITDRVRGRPLRERPPKQRKREPKKRKRKEGEGSGRKGSPTKDNEPRREKEAKKQQQRTKRNEQQNENASLLCFYFPVSFVRFFCGGINMQRTNAGAATRCGGLAAASRSCRLLLICTCVVALWSCVPFPSPSPAVSHSVSTVFAIVLFWFSRCLFFKVHTWHNIAAALSALSPRATESQESLANLHLPLRYYMVPLFSLLASSLYTLLLLLLLGSPPTIRSLPSSLCLLPPLLPNPPTHHSIYSTNNPHLSLPPPLSPLPVSRSHITRCFSARGSTGRPAPSAPLPASRPGMPRTRSCRR